MDESLRIAVQYIHVLAGVLFIGGAFYTILVQTPAIMSAPPAARGAVVAVLAPRQIFYLLRVGELTILSGFARILTSGRGQEFNGLATRWSVSILIGLVLAVTLLGIGHGVLKPGIKRMLTLGPRAAQGDQAAIAESARLVDRFTMVARVQLALGLAIVFSMILARLS